MSLSLARLALRPVVQSLPVIAKMPPHASLAFPANSFFGSPLAMAATATALSPASPLPRSLAVVAARKGYKMKTHKASAKRFRVTGSGKIMRRCTFSARRTLTQEEALQARSGWEDSVFISALHAPILSSTAALSVPPSSPLPPP